MLALLDELSEPYRPLTNALHIGFVIENRDPDQLGGVKVKIPGLMDFDIPDELPWCYPIRSWFIGGSDISNNIFVPEINSQLVVFFPNEDDPYTLFYYGYISNIPNKNECMQGAYPHSYGFHDSTGFLVFINKLIEHFTLEHSSRLQITFDKDGNVTVDIPKNLKITIGGNVKINVADFVEETIDEYRKVSVGDKDELTVIGNRRVKVLADYHELVSGKKTEEAIVGKDSTVGGNLVERINGQHQMEVISHQNITTGGDQNIKSNGNQLIAAALTQWIQAATTHINLPGPDPLVPYVYPPLLPEEPSIIIPPDKEEEFCSKPDPGYSPLPEE